MNRIVAIKQTVVMTLAFNEELFLYSSFDLLTFFICVVLFCVFSIFSIRLPSTCGVLRFHISENNTNRFEV